MPRVDPIILPGKCQVELHAHHTHMPVPGLNTYEEQVHVSLRGRAVVSSTTLSRLEAEVLHKWLGAVLAGEAHTALDVTAQIARNHA